MALLKVIVDFITMLIGAEGARLLREYGAGETPQALSAEEAPRHARAALCAWSGNQHPSLTEPSFKKSASALPISKIYMLINIEKPRVCGPGFFVS